MANITLNNLPTVTSLNGTEPLLGVQSSTSVQITTGQIATYTLGLVGIGLPVTVPNGGTGDTTLTQYGLMFGNGVNPVGTVPPPSGANYVLVGSAGSAPTWQPTIPVSAGVDSVAFGTTGLTPVAATAGVVSVAFGSVPTAAGIYSPATNQIALSTASTQRLLIDATGAATFSTSVTSPLITATASRTATATTGAFSYGTNSFSDVDVLASFQSSVNSYNQTTIQNTSNGSAASAEFIVYNDQGTASTNYATVGINSSGYTGTGAINAAGYGFFLTGSTDLVIGTIGANAMHFVTNSSATDAMTISSAGVVTIPSASITSLTTPLVVGGTTASSTLTLESTSGSGTTDAILFKTGSQSESMRIASSGNVGIGTSSPAVKLDVNGAVNVSNRLLVYSQNSANLTGFSTNAMVLGTVAKNVAPAGNQGTFLISSDDPSTSALQGSISLITDSTAANRRLAIGVIEQGTAYRNITLNEAGGNVGIGTSSPGYKLSIVGDSAAGGIYTATSNTDTTAGSLAGYLGTANGANNYFTLVQAIGGATILSNFGASGLTIQTSQAQPLIFSTTATERMRIDASGNVGIGTTSLTAYNLNIGANITGATTSGAVILSGAVQASVSTAALGFYSSYAQAASATVNVSYHFYAAPSTGGAGSTITQQVGFYAESTLGTSGATTVTSAVGFLGNIASGANRWNLYMAGSANNYMAGSLGVGTTTVGATAGSINAVGAITFNTTTNNQSYTTTGAGTIAISSGTVGSIDNMTIGGTTRAAGNFTTLQANNAVTFATTTNNQSYTTTGAGTITISSGTLGTINNMSIGATTASTGVFTTVTAPTVYGGTTASSTLTLQSTSGAGTTDSVLIKVGNNGAVTAATFNTAGVATSTNWYNTTTQTATNTATLTAAQITGPFLLGTPTATASYTLPLASAVETALGTPPTGTGWEFVVFTTAAFAITLLTATGWTLVGSMATGATANSFARFRAAKTGAGAYSLYRIS